MIRATALLIGMRLMLVGAIAGAATPATKESTESLELRNLVLAGLDERDRKLDNCGFTVDESIENTTSKGSHVFMFRHVYEVRRVGNVLWMHVKDYEQGSKIQIRTEQTVRWDGMTMRAIGWPPYEGTPFAQCTIKAEVPVCFMEGRFSELLGFVMQGPTSAIDGWPPAPLWLRTAVDRGADVDAEWTVEAGRRVISVQTSKYGRTHRLLVDPGRDFLIVRHDYEISNGRAWNRASEQVIEASRISGVWLPTKAARSSSISGHDLTSEFSYSVTGWKVGGIAADEVTVEFPEGARVLDKIRHVAYTIEPHSEGYKLLPLADTTARQVYIPPANAVVPLVDANTSKQYAKHFLAAEPIRRAPFGVPWWGRGLIAVAVLVGCALVGRSTLRRMLSSCRPAGSSRNDIA